MCTSSLIPRHTIKSGCLLKAGWADSIPPETMIARLSSLSLFEEIILAHISVQSLYGKIYQYQC